MHAIIETFEQGYLVSPGKRVNMNSTTKSRIEKIRSDRKHGAGWLSRKAVNVLAQSILENRTESTSYLMSEVNTIAASLKAARPDMVSISNYISLFQEKMIVCEREGYALDALKQYSARTARLLVNKSLAATRQTARKGAHLINDLSIIITCSYSSTLCQTLITAHRENKFFRVIITGSMRGTLSYGNATASQLKRHNIPVKVINDNEIKRYIVRATMAMTGADRILTDGSAVNGSPSRDLAQAACTAKIPFYIICESTKFDPYMAGDEVKIIEPGFDFIPADFITGIITENISIWPAKKR